MFTASKNFIVDIANDDIELELKNLQSDSVLNGPECKDLVPTYSHFDFQKSFNFPAKYVGCLVTQICVKNCCLSLKKEELQRVPIDSTYLTSMTTATSA
jgi:hypothetical protein